MTTRKPTLVGAVGAIGAAMVVFGLIRAVAGEREPEASSVAELAVLAPAAGDTVSAGPLVVRFRADTTLALGPNGWQANELHLHAYLDGREYMPAAADITPADDGEFVWQLPALQPGEHTLSLAWSRTMHETMSEGSSQVTMFTVR